jgi:hypothetical protein
MPRDHTEEIKGKITELREILDHFGDARRDLNQVLKFIHQPGWTTPAEFALVEAVLSAEKKYALATLQLNAAFVSAASRVELNPQPLPP